MRLRIILVSIFILIIVIISGLIFALPTKDYMKMTFSEKINAGYTAHILINGDSIGGTANEGEWCSILKNIITKETSETVEINNISKPGNSSFAGIASWEIMEDVNQRLSDLVILCYGQNDVDDESFAINYEALIRNTIAGNPNAEIIAVLESSQREYTNKIMTIIELCNYYNIPYVDTIKAFKNSGYSYDELSDDGTHPNAKGKEIYAMAIWNVIKHEFLEKQNFLDFKGERPKNKKAKNTEANRYLVCCYIPSDKMKVQGKTVYVNIPTCQIIGMDMMLVSGEHDININLNGNKYDVGYSWKYDFNQRHINEVLSGKFNEGDIVINFDDIDMVNTLNGLICFK